MSVVEDSTQTNGGGWVGRALRRKEDPRLITGQGTYVDDIVLPGMLFATFVRSPEAHARIVSIDASAALERSDVKAVYTGEDLDLAAGLPMAWAPPGVTMNAVDNLPLSKDEVNHVGDAVAVVIGTGKYSVVDAAEEVMVEYDPLPVVVDPEAALKDAGTLVHAATAENKTHEWELAGGDVDAALAAADLVVERRIVNQRTAGGAIEPRGVVAEFRAGQLTLWSSTQIPHLVRSFLAGELGLTEHAVRVIAPEVGGAFGSKLQHYGEEAALAWASRKLGAPIKWTETRSENMMATHHGRDQIDYVKFGANRDGTITAIDIRIIADLGAYFLLLTPFIPSFGGFVAGGCYKVPNVRTHITGVYTNKFPTDAIRGAGRPEATHLIEVMMDQVADELGMDRLELRRKNFIPKEDFPATVAVGLVYDSGDYQGALDKLLTHVDLEEVERQKAELAERGIRRGIGFSTYMEICGLAPSRVTGPNGVGILAGFWESAVVRVHPSGSVTVFTGTSPHGQGLETAFAQITADRLGVTPDQVEVIHGDTGTGPQGMGTYGSRSISVGGESVARAAEKVAEKAKRIIAHQLEAAPEDIELTGAGQFSVRGSPEKGMTLAEAAGAAYIPENLPDGMEAGLEESNFYDPENFVFPFGAHACIVDVDEATGKVEVKGYVAVDDCGPAINPNLIAGQVHGGVVHAIGQALYEQVHYDEDGQLTTGTFVDYCLPTAAEVPNIETDRTETPSPSNSLGVKGVGEAGTIAASPAVTNAVIDALRPVGVTYLDMPMTPMRVWQAIRDAKGAPA